MKTAYQTPRIQVFSVGQNTELIDASRGCAVADDGRTVTFEGIKTGGDAGTAAARGGSMWDDD